MKLLLILLFILCNLSNSDDGLDFYLVNNYTRATTSRMRDEARWMGNNVISPFCRKSGLVPQSSVDLGHIIWV